MKKKILLFLFIFICFILQSTIFRSLAFAGVGPNLLLVAVSSFGFMLGRKSGIVLGLISGLLCDLFFSQFFGFYTLLYMLIGYWNGYFKRAFYPEDIKLPILLISCSTLVFETIIFLFGFLLRGKVDILYYFLHIILPSMLYTVLIALVQYPIILLLHHYFDELQRRSARKFGAKTEE